MKKFLLIPVTSFLLGCSFSANAIDGAAILFRGKAASLSSAEKEEIYKLIGVKVSPDEKNLLTQYVEMKLILIFRSQTLITTKFQR